MNRPSEQNTTSGDVKTVGHTQKFESRKGTLTLNKFDIRNTRPATPIAAAQVIPNYAIKGPFTQISAKDALNVPRRPAQGDDDVMSQQAKQS